MNLPLRFGAEPRPLPEFPYLAGEKLTGAFMVPGSYVTVKTVGDWSFIGIVHGADAWQMDGTELVLGFNLDWERYPLTPPTESGTLAS